MKWRPSVLLVALAAPASGCMEMMINTIEGAANRPAVLTAELDQMCGLPASVPAVRKDEPPGFRAYEGPRLERYDVGVMVVAAVSDTCAGWSGNRPYWEPYVVSVDGNGELLGPDDEKGAERRMRFPRRCVRCDECLRFAIAPGVHAVAVNLYTQGSASPARKAATLKGSVRFEARAGGLYSIRACQPYTAEGPVFWVRDEATQECVSAICPA